MSDLRARLERLAEEGTPRGASKVIAAARASLEQAPMLTATGRPLAHRVAAFAVVLVVLTALAFVGLQSDESERNDRVAASRTEAFHLEPTTLPSGLELAYAEDEIGGSSGGSAEWDSIQRWVRFDSARHRPLEAFDVQWGPGPGSPSDPIQGYRFDAEVVTIRGLEGVYNRSLNAFAWEEPAGRAVSVSSRELDRAVLAQIVERLEETQDDGFALRKPPAGFELVAEWPGLASDGSSPRVLAYLDGKGRGVHIHIVDNTEQPPGINLYPSFSDARLVRVRGRDAVIASRFFGSPSVYPALGILQPDLVVQWLEHDDTRVTVSGVGLERDVLLSIARGLRPVSEARWQRLTSRAPAPTYVAAEDYRPDVRIFDVHLFAEGECVDHGAPRLCSEPHDGESFATFEVRGDHEPSPEIQGGCRVLAEIYLGHPLLQAEYSIGGTGTGEDPIELTCQLGQPAMEPLTETARRSTDDPWEQDIEVGADGHIDVTAFNRFIADRSPTWARSTIGTTWQLLGLGPNAEGFVAIDEERSSVDDAVIIVTISDLPDDSTAAVRYRLQLRRAEEGRFQVESAEATTRCQPGRGHREFKAGACS